MTGALALVAALTISSQLQTHPTGLPSVGPSRANSLRTAPIMDKLYEQAGKPALDFDFARYKDLHDNASGATSLINFSRSAAQSPGTYVGSDGLIHDAAVNLALYSEQFNVSWANSNSSDKANQAIAPDGKQTADKVIPNSGTVVNAGIYQFPYPSTDAEIRTFSVYAKSAEFSKFVIKIGGGDAVLPIALFNLQNGQIESVQDGSAKIENAGNGWFRVSLTFANSSSQFVPNMMACNDECAVGNRDVTITGDDTSGIYIWGAQLEETDPATMQPTAYIKTTSQALAAPRFDHDPVTGESLGLLVEEQRTNYFTNSDSLATQNVTTTATAYTLSFYGAGTIDLTGTHTATVVGAGDYPTRTTLTFTPTAGTLTATVTGTVQYAQLEQGAFPTSYIPTVTSQTRYADVAAVQDEDFSTTNLLAYSESFDVGWSRTRLEPVTANATTAPDGTMTADYIEQQSGQATAGGVYQNKTVTSPFVASVYAKAAEKNFLYILGSSQGAFFDLQSGTVDTIAGANIQATITDVGDGWYRCSIMGSYSFTGNLVYYPTDSGGTLAVTDSGGIYLWGASLTATEYPVEYTTTRNLLTDSQDFERGTWSKVLATVEDDVASSPDGTLSADRLEASSTSVISAASENVTVIGSKAYTSSFYAKKDSASIVYLREYYTNGSEQVSYFDLDVGAAGTTSPSHTVSIIDSGNGWYRISITSTTTASITQAWQIGMADADGSKSVTINKSVLVWGAQLEPGTATDYVRTVDVVGKSYNWYEPTEGTVFVEADTYMVGNFGRVYSISDGNVLSRIETYANDSSHLRLRGSSINLDLDAGTLTANTFSSFGVAYQYGNYAVTLDGGAAATSSTAQPPPTVSSLTIGGVNYDTNYLNGHIKRLTYWPRRQSDSTLQVITQ